MGSSENPPDMMEEYNGCSVPLYTVYRLLGLSVGLWALAYWADGIYEDYRFAFA